MKITEEDFASQLGYYRERAGLSQQELANKIDVHRNSIDNWENRTKPPKFRGKVLRLADELNLTKDERKAFIQAARFSVEWWPAEVWVVPQQRDMFFTGRDDVFQSLRQLLVPGSTTALTQAISGLGGIGKTHTAVEYAHRFHQAYEAVLWLQADSWDILALECVKVASELGLSAENETQQVIADVRHWLEKHRHWLLILDNVENPQEILPKFLPTSHPGCVLVTTRVQDMEPLAQTQVLSVMSEQEGILFLLRRTKKIASKAGLEKATPEQYAEAKKIWELMEGLPLALDQAGAYILETHCLFSDYEEQYNRRRKELLDRRGKRFIGHEESVAVTFSLALERIEEISLMAADILRVCAWLYEKAIPEEIFQEGAPYLGEHIATNVDNCNEAIGILRDYSLVQRNAEIRTLTLHRLVQAALKVSMSEEAQYLWVERVVKALSQVFPFQEQPPWFGSQRYLFDAFACASLIKQWNLVCYESAYLLFKVALYLHDQGRYRDAEPHAQDALSIMEQVYGSDHMSVSQALTVLANIYNSQGKYEQAEPLLQQAMTILMKTCHPAEPIVTACRKNLAMLYTNLRKYEQAESLYQENLGWLELIVGSDRPQIILIPYLTDLAEVYRSQGKYEQAEPLYQRALTISEQEHGLDDRNTAMAINNLANIYYNQGKYEQAEPLYQHVLTINKQIHGLDDLDTAMALCNLAILYRSQGKYEQAEPLFQQATAINEKLLGPEYPDLYYGLFPLIELAKLYNNWGRQTDAETLFQRALSIREQQLGPEHLVVAPLLMNLANLYSKQGKYAEAELLFQRALSIREQQLGPEHPETAEVLHDSASFQEAEGNLQKALSLYQRALASYEYTLGPHHLKTTEARQCVYFVLRELGRHDEAASLQIRLSEADKVVNQEQHPEE